MDFISVGGCVVGLSLGMTIESWGLDPCPPRAIFCCCLLSFHAIGSYVGSIWQIFYGWGLGFLCNLSWIQISSYIRSKLGLGFVRLMKI